MFDGLFVPVYLPLRVILPRRSDITDSSFEPLEKGLFKEKR
jgi:hypothetical protein